MNLPVRISAAIIAISVLSPAAHAQQADVACGLGSGSAILEGGDVRAQVFATGFLFFGASQTQAIHRYSVPKDASGGLIYGAGLWLSGTLDDTLRASVGFYGRQSYWPGPLDQSGQPLDDCSGFDRVWSVTRADLQEYDRTRVPTEDLATWPTGLGAPTVDANGLVVNIPERPLSERLNRVVNLEAGERPYVRGVQTHWWIVNDVASAQADASYQPLHVEVGATAFVFDTPGALGRTTFFEFRLRKPAGPPIDDAYIGMYSDIDLGFFDDDYMGSDSLLGLAYIYNADGLDEATYGARPPAVGIDFLRGPISDGDGKDNDLDGAVDEVGERTPMTSAVYPNTSSDPLQARYYFTGRLRNGAPMVSYDQGWPTPGRDDPHTRWQFWGEPGEFWSELDTDGQGTASLPSDRRIVSGAGPVALGPGSPQNILVAYLTSFGEDHLDSVRQLKADSRFIQQLADDGLLDIPAVIGEPEPDAEDQPLSAALFPVPGGDHATLRYHLPTSQEVDVEVFDALGRSVTRLQGDSREGTHSLRLDLSRFSSGLYLVRYRIGPRHFTKRLPVVR